jgi:purine-binding chemotaxis protein CheW
MTDAPIAADAADLREFIAFQIGAQEYCVDITVVRELRGWTPPTPLPRAPSYVAGVVNLRGSVLPVVDLSERLGMGPAKPTPRHVVIVVAIGDRMVGLLVDAVCEIVVCPASAVQATPEVPSESVHAFVSGIVTIEDRMVGLLVTDTLLPPVEAQAA